MKLPTIAIALTLTLLPAWSTAQTNGDVAKAAITIPDGWIAHQTLDIPGFVMSGLWYAPQEKVKGDNINVGSSTLQSGTSLDAIADSTRTGLQKLYGADNYTGDHAETACNGTTAGWYFEGRYTAGSTRLVIEQVAVPGSSRLYVATYTRAEDHPEDAQARKALDTLCAPQT